MIPLPYIALLVLVGLAFAMYAFAVLVPVEEPAPKSVPRDRVQSTEPTVTVVSMTAFAQQIQFKLADDTDLSLVQFDRVANLTSVNNSQMKSLAASLMVVAAVATVSPPSGTHATSRTSKSVPPASR